MLVALLSTRLTALAARHGCADAFRARLDAVRTEYPRARLHRNPFVMLRCYREARQRD